MSKYLDKEDYLPYAENLDTGEWIRINHDTDDCSGDSQSLKIERKDNGNVTAKCFRCGKFGSYNKDVIRSKKVKTELRSNTGSYTLPNDSSWDYGEWHPKVRLRLRGYGIKDEDCKRFKIGYSASLNRLILPVFDEDGLAFYQTKKCFEDDENSSKYTTYRNRDKELIINPDSSETLVIVEDLFSGIRCGKILPTLVLFGNSISDLQLNKIKEYKNFIIFLDDDNRLVKLKQIELKNQLEQFSNSKIITKIGKDPKELEHNVLRNILIK
jgi:hypothetical protein